MRLVREKGGSAAKLLLWLMVTSLVAFFVARNVEPAKEPGDDAELHVPQVQAEQRQTTELQEMTIQPTLSGDGTVIEQEEEGEYALQAAITPADQAYRLLQDPIGIKALIVGGPAGFDCLWEGLVNTPSGLMMQCQIPDDIEVVAGLQGTMVLQLEESTIATGLPVSAVVGTNQQGQVIVLHDDGTTEVRQVKLGKSDTFNIELIDGLEEGETVFLNPVQSDFSRPGS